MNATIDAIEDLARTLMLSSYASSRPDLVALYERAKNRQWNATTDLPWDDPVQDPIVDETRSSLYGTPWYEALSAEERSRYNTHEMAWVLSQFMHGEQASLLACGQLMAALPEMDAKFYAASQGYDEARHVEVYRRYLTQRLGIVYDADPNVRFIADTALASADWTMKLVGTQLVIESLAMGAFKTLLESARDPLLVQLLTSVMQDEARHVAFGRLALESAVRELEPRERDDYEDFVFYCAEVMYNGFFPMPVFEQFGLKDTPLLRSWVFESEQRRLFRRDLFSVFIPSARAVGLLTDRTARRYEALGLLAYADAGLPEA
jgi:para-aminobenzoate N-oxygenase AurF